MSTLSDNAFTAAHLAAAMSKATAVEYGTEPGTMVVRFATPVDRDDAMTSVKMVHGYGGTTESTEEEEGEAGPEWVPDLFSVRDGSPVRLVKDHGDGTVTIENECGDAWADHAAFWQPAAPSYVELTPLEATEAFVRWINEEADIPEGYRFEVGKPGQKYVRIVMFAPGDRGGSVHAFVNLSNGDLLKSASWSRPAEHSRGNLVTKLEDAKNRFDWAGGYLYLR